MIRLENWEYVVDSRLIIVVDMKLVCILLLSITSIAHHHRWSSSPLMVINLSSLWFCVQQRTSGSRRKPFRRNLKQENKNSDLLLNNWSTQKIATYTTIEAMLMAFFLVSPPFRFLALLHSLYHRT